MRQGTRIGRWLVVLLTLWIGSYLAYRALGQEVWAADGKTHVVLPGGPGVALYYIWRPLMLCDAAATGMAFHIGPHRS